jgi:hypothetical protein
MWKIRLLAKFIYYWDVLFTLIDEWQLRKYVKLRKKMAEMIHDYNRNEKLKDCEDHEDWEDVK